MEYVLVFAFLFAIGAISHVLRGLVGRFLELKLLNRMVSPGQAALDGILNVEFDDHGFYRVDSVYNLMIAIVSAILIGVTLIAVSPDYFKFFHGIAALILNSCVTATAPSWHDILAIFG